MVEESIVDPNTVIAKGYPPNVMPANFERNAEPEELEDLVEYLVDIDRRQRRGRAARSPRAAEPPAAAWRPLASSR